MKYKVGDKVRIVSEKTGFAWNWAGKMDKWLGKVMTIRGISGNAYRMQEDSTEFDGCGWYWGEEMISGLAETPESIHITRDGNFVQAVHKRGGEIIQRATAKCSPSDTFDFAVGAELAFQRLMHPEVKKAPANKYEGMSDNELSNAICSYRRCDNWGSTVKNCPSRPYCHDGKGSYAYILEHRSEAISYLLAEDEVKQDKPAEPAKAEPVKLYCVKDKINWNLKSGEIVTLDAEGHIDIHGEKTSCTYTGKELAESVAEHAGWGCYLVPLVKRPAKVGEWVLVSNDALGTAVDYRGRVVKITSICRIPYFTPDGDTIRQAPLTHGEYLVLDGYQPEPKQPEPKPQYWSGKVVCIKGGEHHTLGAVYEIKDGIINHNTGDDYNFTRPVRSVEQLNLNSVPQFAEFKGEAHD